MGQLDATQVSTCEPSPIWDGAMWREERRINIDHRVGRRRTDAWFPYNVAFVVQVMGQDLKKKSVKSDRAMVARYCGKDATDLGYMYSFDV